VMGTPGCMRVQSKADVSPPRNASCFRTLVLDPSHPDGKSADGERNRALSKALAGTLGGEGIPEHPRGRGGAGGPRGQRERMKV